jgi:hypothetical protein
MDNQSKNFYLSEFQPKILAKHHQNHEWLFAQYFEPVSERNDDREYRVFLFRNKDRTVFGYKEFWGKIDGDFRAMASKVIANKVFRDTMVSDDEILRKIWKRH